MDRTSDATVAWKKGAGHSQDLGSQPTVESGPSGSGEAGRTTFRSTYTTPLETLQVDEVVRFRRFLLIAISIMLIGGTAILFLPGDEHLRSLLWGTLAVAFVTCSAFLYYIGDEKNYTPERALIPVTACILAVSAATLYFGVYSAAQMLFVLGIYFFGLSSSRLATLFCYLACAIIQGVAMLLVSLGVLPDRGIIQRADIPLAQQIILVGLIEMIYFMTYLFARVSRRTTLTAIQGLERALRQISQREALLQEANQDLERALGGRRGGRFSGERLGRWRLGDVLGRGAMGEVYQARAEDTDQEGAVKVLFPQAGADVHHLRRFLREAEVMSQLDSPHVVRVYDTGDGSDGLVPYIAMERLHGNDLAWHLRKTRRLSRRAVVELVGQVAAALEQARGKAIVHRDLKPQNLFFARVAENKRLWKVLDFGVSRIGNVAGTLTRGHIVGTPGYMAPEQARGGDVDHRADVFALSVIAYRSLTGRPAFAGSDYPRVMFNLVYTQPTRPSELVDVPEDVELVLAIGLAKDARDRFATAVELAEAFEQALDGALPHTLRDRATAILRAAPWGKKIKSA